MFGNPLVSNTPVDDIYATQADVQANSFSNPVNYANQNPNWGIDPSLLSPSYTAMYRPQYGGPSGANEYGHPGFFRGAYNLSPFSREVGWGNPVMHQQSSINDITNRPTDAAMWGFQRIALPIAAYGMGSKLAPMLGLGWKTGARFGSGFGGGMAAEFGFGSQGLRATGSAFKAAYGAEGLSGIANVAKGIGMRGAVGLGARAGMAAVGGAALGLLAPIALAQGALEFGERGITNPYINTRKGAEDLRANFAGITFGDSEGNSITGKGLSFSESTRMAKDITNAGIDDMHFDTDEYRMGADMIGRTGLLDTASKGQITQRIKEDMKQVKLIMGIANMPEIKDAVELLAKLQMAGASTTGGLNSTAAKTMGDLGRYASMAGTTVQRMMNTVGAQGQYLYQANGMTPYLGQLAAGAAYSSFATAQRMGLISPEQMARMGGLEGATQANLTGQINAGQTLYNKMAMFNSFIGGANGTSAGYGQNQNSIDVIHTFGASMAKDPLGTYGAMSYFSRQMAGKQIEERGNLAIEDQVMSRVKSMAPWLIKDNGKLDAIQAEPFLKQMNLSDDEIQAFFNARMAETDEDTYNTKRRALNADNAERIRQYISDTGTYGGAIGVGVRNLRKAGRAVVRGVKHMTVDPLLAMTGSAGDLGQSLTDWAWYGSTVGNDGDTLDSVLGKTQKYESEKLFTTKLSGDGLDPRIWSKEVRQKNQAMTAAADINQLIIQNGPGAELARKYMNSTKDSDKSDALWKLVHSGHLRSGAINNYEEDFQDSGDFKALKVNLDNRDKFTSDVKPPGDPDAFNDELGKVDNLKVDKDKKVDTLLDIRNAIQIATDKTINPGNADKMMEEDGLLQNFAKRHRLNSGMDAYAMARKVAINARQHGIDGFAITVGGLDKDKYKSDEDRLKDAYQINGGAHKNAFMNANDISEEEALGQVAETKEGAMQQTKLYKAYKEGRLDFQSMKQISSQIDMSEAVREFRKGVKEFVGGVGDKGKNAAKPENKSPYPRSLWSSFPSNDSNQKVNK